MIGIDEYDYLRKALNSTTDINGGLVLTNVMMLRNAEGEVTAGMSGLKEDGVLLWGGGDYDDAKIASDNLPVLIKKDGTGRIGGGNFDQKYFYYEDSNLGRAVLSAVGRTQMEADFYREFDFPTLSFKIKTQNSTSSDSYRFGTGKFIEKTFRGGFVTDRNVVLNLSVSDIRLAHKEEEYTPEDWSTIMSTSRMFLRVEDFELVKRSNGVVGSIIGQCNITSYQNISSYIQWTPDENGEPIGHLKYNIVVNLGKMTAGSYANIYKGDEIGVRCKIAFWGVYSSAAQYLDFEQVNGQYTYDAEVNIYDINLKSVTARNYTHITPSSIVMARDARDNKQSEVIFEKLPTSATGLKDGQLYVSQDLNDAFGQLCDVVNACIDVIKFHSDTNTNSSLKSQYKSKVSSSRTKVGTQRLIASKKTT